MNISYSRAEQETVITWNEDDKAVEIYTASPVSMRKLDKLSEEHPDVYKRIWTETSDDGRITAAKYMTVSKYIKFRAPVSEARMGSIRKAVAKAREANQNKA